MERKLTLLGMMCFLALAGLSVSSVSCLPVGKNPPAPPRNKTNLDLKVEAVYHDGKVKKYMSYVTYVSSLDSNGTLRSSVVQKKMDGKDPQLTKYTDFFQRIPRINLSPSILATGSKTTCLRKDDIRVKRGNVSYVWAPQKMEASYSGLLSQCDQLKATVLPPTTPRPGNAWYLDTCLSGNRLVNSPRSSPLNPNAVNSIKAPIPLYTIYISTTDHIMTLNPLVTFNVSSFLRSFPFDRMEIDYVHVVTLCSAGEKETLKSVMSYMGYVVQEDLMPSAIVFVKKSMSSGPIPQKVASRPTIRSKDPVVQEVTTSKAMGFVMPTASVPVPEILTPKTTIKSKDPVVPEVTASNPMGFVKPEASAPVPLKTTMSSKNNPVQKYVTTRTSASGFGKPNTSAPVPQNATSKTAMRNKTYVAKEEVVPILILYVPTPTKATKTRNAAVPGKPIGHHHHHLSLLIAIVGIGMELQLRLLSG